MVINLLQSDLLVVQDPKSGTIVSTGFCECYSMNGDCRSFGVAAGGGNPPGSDARVLQGANAVELRPRRDSMGEDREDDQNKVSFVVICLSF